MRRWCETGLSQQAQWSSKSSWRSLHKANVCSEILYASYDKAVIYCTVPVSVPLHISRFHRPHHSCSVWEDFSMQYESICLHWWKIIAKQTNHLCHIEQDSTPGAQQLDNCKNKRQTDGQQQRGKKREGERRTGESGFTFTVYMRC